MAVPLKPYSSLPTAAFTPLLNGTAIKKEKKKEKNAASLLRRKINTHFHDIIFIVKIFMYPTFMYFRPNTNQINTERAQKVWR